MTTTNLGKETTQFLCMNLFQMPSLKHLPLFKTSYFVVSPRETEGNLSPQLRQ